MVGKEGLRLQPTMTVRHFKRDLLPEENKGLMYLYKIIGFAKHTETEEDLVIYQALYGENSIWARPLEIFMGKVNRDKYPNAKQEYVFEEYKEE